MFTPHVPSWFLKALSIIDKTYRVSPTDDGNGYFIIKDIDLSIKENDGKTLSIIDHDIKTLRIRGPMPVLWIPDFGEQWLDVLRGMKLKGIELGIFDNPLNELAYYQKLKRDAKKKKEELAVDMISEGLLEADKMDRRKSFSYGGEKKP